MYIYIEKINIHIKKLHHQYVHTYIAKIKLKSTKSVYHCYRKLVQITKAHSPVCIWVPNCCWTFPWSLLNTWNGTVKVVYRGLALELFPCMATDGAGCIVTWDPRKFICCGMRGFRVWPRWVSPNFWGGEKLLFMLFMLAWNPFWTVLWLGLGCMDTLLGLPCCLWFTVRMGACPRGEGSLFCCPLGKGSSGLLVLHTGIGRLTLDGFTAMFGGGRDKSGKLKVPPLLSTVNWNPFGWTALVGGTNPLLSGTTLLPGGRGGWGTCEFCCSGWVKLLTVLPWAGGGWDVTRVPGIEVLIICPLAPEFCGINCRTTTLLVSEVWFPKEADCIKLFPELIGLLAIIIIVGLFIVAVLCTIR